MDKIIKKRILLGVCGGIAAYKSAELVRLLCKQEYEVRVVMTHSATEFVTPLTFQALSGNPVAVELLDQDQENAMGHINFARWADLILIAPATANIIAKFAHGLADDLLSTLYLAATCPIFIAPAMNQGMWHKLVTQENINKLKSQGVELIGPAAGEQACGEIGFGRMVEVSEIVLALAGTNDLHGLLNNKKVLISAGPTREPIDPVRYISNRSSGKMGYALAEAAVYAGADVTLVSGPVDLAKPNNLQLIRVETAEQMHHAVICKAKKSDIYIGAAAVADYTPVSLATKKIKKQTKSSTINLNLTKDILADVTSLSNRPHYVVGFAAETDQLESYAIDKLNKKNLDMIAANWVGKQQGGFDKEENALQVYWNSGNKTLEMTDKKRLAEQLIYLIAERLNEKNTAKNSG